MCKIFNYLKSDKLVKGGGYEMVCDENKKQNRYMYVIPFIDTFESLTFLLYSSTLQPCLGTL